MLASRLRKRRCHRTKLPPNDPTADLRQQWPLPRAPRPIVVIGAGSIVRDAHLPVYRRLNFPVAGIFDVNPARLAIEPTPSRFYACSPLSRKPRKPVTPCSIRGSAGSYRIDLEELPTGSAVLIQKPMGRDLAEARHILAIARKRKLVSAMNFNYASHPTCSRCATHSSAVLSATSISKCASTFILRGSIGHF